MDLLSYLRVLRQRWTFLVVPLVGAVLLGWISLPETNAATPVATSYTATATLIGADPGTVTTGEVPVSLPTIALFATVGEVPKRAASKLNYKGEPQVLASEVTVTPLTETNTLTIDSVDTSARAVERRVNAFAAATVEFFRAKQTADAQRRIRAQEAQLTATGNQVRSVQTQLAALPNDALLQARLEALQSDYSTQFGQIQALKRQVGGAGPITVLQEAVAIPQVVGGFVAPTNPVFRLGIAGLIGLLLGAALALVIERIDSRLRSRNEVEAAYDSPVLAEIPQLPVGQRDTHWIASSTHPASAVAEAHRALRSAVYLATGPARRDGQGMVLLVTSALAGEGKTSTVANLAAVMAESGKSVIVLSLDLRDPRLHEYFDEKVGTGISDLLAADRARHLEQVLRTTAISGVRIATSGQRLDHPGALLASVGPMIDAARSAADVVIIDSPPVLAVSDALDMAQFVDSILVVTRHNRTTAMQAAAAQRLLARLRVPTLGTVVVGSTERQTDTDWFSGRRLLNRGPQDRTYGVTTASND